MDNHQFVTVTRTLVKRGLTDIERKLVAGAMSGGIGYALLEVAASYGVVLPANVAPLVPAAIGWIGAYAAHSLGAVTTVQTTANGATEVSTSTGSVKIPAAYLPQPAPVPVPAPSVPAPEPVVPDEVPDAAPADPNAATAIINPNDRFARVLATLPSAQDDH